MKAVRPEADKPEKMRPFILGALGTARGRPSSSASPETPFRHEALYEVAALYEVGPLFALVRGFTSRFGTVHAVLSGLAGLPGPSGLVLSVSGLKQSCQCML